MKKPSLLNMFVADHSKLLYLYPCGKKNRKDASMSSRFIWKYQTTKKKHCRVKTQFYSRFTQYLKILESIPVGQVTAVLIIWNSLLWLLRLHLLFFLK